MFTSEVADSEEDSDEELVNEFKTGIVGQQIYIHMK
jgi:hypothetical protein